MHNAVQAALHMGFLLNLHVDFHVWIKSCCITVTVTFAFEETVVIFKVHLVLWQQCACVIEVAGGNGGEWLWASTPEVSL